MQRYRITLKIMDKKNAYVEVHGFPYRSRTRERHLGPYAEVDGNPEDNRQEKDISDYR